MFLVDMSRIKGKVGEPVINIILGLKVYKLTGF